MGAEGESELGIARESLRQKDSEGIIEMYKISGYCLYSVISVWSYVFVNMYFIVRGFVPGLYFC